MKLYKKDIDLGYKTIDGESISFNNPSIRNNFLKEKSTDYDIKLIRCIKINNY
jgi:hypothetical protein